MNGSSDGEFTKIPNSVLDNMDKMNESELRIALAIARKTLGWQKPEDRMSFSQFEAMTGLSRTAVRDGINAAIKHHVIRRDSVGAQTYRYSLPVGLSYQFDDATSSNSLPEPVGLSYQLAQKPVGLSYSQKKGSKETKETTTIVAHASQNGGGGIADRLRDLSLDDNQIRASIEGMGDLLTDSLIDQWQEVIARPPKGLDTPIGTMIARFKRGNTQVPRLGTPATNGRPTPPASTPETIARLQQEKEALIKQHSGPPRLKHG